MTTAEHVAKEARQKFSCKVFPFPCITCTLVDVQVLVRTSWCGEHLLGRSMAVFPWRGQGHQGHLPDTEQQPGLGYAVRLVSCWCLIAHRGLGGCQVAAEAVAEAVEEEVRPMVAAAIAAAAAAASQGTQPLQARPLLLA